jgi:endonuclease YncB( thermonuclease family)
MSRSFVLSRRVLAVALFILAGCSAQGQSYTKGDLITGPAKVVNGHTFDIKSTRIILWGIDAPERGASCYRNGRKWKPADESASALRRCVEGKTLTCRVQNTEREWFRTLHTSECYTEDGRDIGDCMVRSGWATDYTCYSGGFYKDQEAEARSKLEGVWQCDTGPGTKRWGRSGPGANCESPTYRPLGAPK